MSRSIMAVLGLIVIIITGIWNHVTGDYYNMDLSPGALQAVAGAAEAEENKLKIWSTDPAQPALMQSDEFVLEKGSYQMTVTYTSAKGKSVAELFSNGAADENNQKGVLLASAEMYRGQKQIIIPVEAQRLYQDISFRIYCEQGEILIEKINIKSVRPHYTDSLFLICVFLTILIGFYVVYRKKKASWKPIPLFFLGTAILLTCLPIFNDYLISGHDISYHLGRIDGIYYGILSGNFPVRINPVHAAGYGTAMPIMYPDLLLYLPALFRLCGVSLMLSYKLFLFLLNAGTAFISYQCFKRMAASDNVGLIASILYSLGSYRLVNLYERAALGEAISMAFLPLVLWAMYEIVFRDKKYWIWAAIGYAMIFQSHIISIFMTVLFTVMLLIPCLPRLLKQKDRLFRLFLAGSGALLLSACSLVPFLSYLRLPMKIGEINGSIHPSAVYPLQMFTSYWNGGISGNINLGSTEKEMPLTIGILLLIGILIFLFRHYVDREKWNQSYKKIGMLMLLAGGGALFLSSWLFPWDMLQKIDVLNRVFSKMEFSFRFLMIASLFLTIPAALGYASVLKEGLAEKQLVCLLCIFFAVTLFFLGGTLEKKTIPNKSDCISQYLYDPAYLYQNADEISWKANGKAVKLSEDMQAVLSKYDKDGASLSFYYEPISITEKSYFDIPLAYYPGYVAKWNGKKIETEMSETGMLRIMSPVEEGMIEISFREKPLWIAADLTSLVSWGGAVILLLNNKKRKEKHGV